MEYKITLTYNSWAGYAKIEIIDECDPAKIKEKTAWYEKETLIWGGRDFGRPAKVKMTKRKA